VEGVHQEFSRFARNITESALGVRLVFVVEGFQLEEVAQVDLEQRISSPPVSAPMDLVVLLLVRVRLLLFVWMTSLGVLGAIPVTRIFRPSREEGVDLASSRVIQCVGRL
jgi:hypothetical protein